MGKYLRGSGAGKTWIESLTLGVNVVESVLNGRHYVRSRKEMLLLGEIMLQWCEFFKIYETQQYADELEILWRQASSREPETSGRFHASVSWSYDCAWLPGWWLPGAKRTSADLQALLFHSRHFLGRVHCKICPANQNSRLAVNFAELLHIHL